MSAELIAQYEEHLALVRNLADNSIRGYVSDLESFLAHIEKLGVTEFHELTISDIRSWLAEITDKGAVRSTIARRIVSIRAFTYWGASQGWLKEDIGQALAIPKAHRTLPDILDLADTEIVLESMAQRAGEEPTAINIRDLAMIEVLYASGIRVSELCGLDSSDIDTNRNTLQVIGKGNKERTVPLGIPAMKALQHYIATARPQLVNEKSLSLIHI